MTLFPLLIPILALSPPVQEPDSLSPGTTLVASSETRATDHAPIGVMGDHTHRAGEWMVSVRSMCMSMTGLRDGSTDLTPNALLGNPMMGTGYLSVPTSMTMDMLMFGAMYAPSDELTLMAMVPYSRKDMNLTHTSGATFSTRTEGLGDVSLTALHDVSEEVHVALGLSIPTGSTTERDTALGMGGVPTDVRLPYPMQLGSGTFDLRPGVTWTRRTDDWSFGAQGTYVARIDENEEGYALGDEVHATAWVARNLASHWSVSARLAYLDRGNIDGTDETQGTPGGMPPAIALPNADPNLQGARRMDLFLGVNHVTPDGHRLALEVGTPVMEHLDGPQMSTDWIATIGWQWSF